VKYSYLDNNDNQIDFGRKKYLTHYLLKKDFYKISFLEILMLETEKTSAGERTSSDFPTNITLVLHSSQKKAVKRPT
jgi:hypothetical protein